MAVAVGLVDEDSRLETRKSKEEKMDDEIAKVRAEIQQLTQKKKLLVSTLLSSTQIQENLHPSNTSNTNIPIEFTPLIDQSKQHSQSNAHRLAFGVTAFPLIDPSPDTSNKSLLGIRFDICKRNGRFETPYYVICQRVGNDEDSTEQPLRVHKHTIPALVPLQEYEARYLPLPSEDGYETKQDLHEFVHRVRHDLHSWRLRHEAIELLNEELEIPKAKPNHESGEGHGNGHSEREEATQSNEPENDEHMSDDEEEGNTEGLYGVTEISAVGVDAYYARLVWSDGKVGRIKIMENGNVEKAVVFGMVDGENARLKQVERKLCQDNTIIVDFITRLKEVYEQSTLDK